MKTEHMQKRLEAAMREGKIKEGEAYSVMPSDCRGDGYDIAVKSRTDETGDYEVSGVLCRVECVVKVGARLWGKGIPLGYKLTVGRQRAEYTLLPGERAIVHHVSMANGAYTWMRGHVRGYWRLSIVRDVNGSLRRNSRNVVAIVASTSEGLTGVTSRSAYYLGDQLGQLEARAKEINKGATNAF